MGVPILTLYKIFGKKPPQWLIYLSVIAGFVAIFVAVYAVYLTFVH